MNNAHWLEFTNKDAEPFWVSLFTIKIVKQIDIGCWTDTIESPGDCCFLLSSNHQWYHILYDLNRWMGAYAEYKGIYVYQPGNIIYKEGGFNFSRPGSPYLTIGDKIRFDKMIDKYLIEIGINHSGIDAGRDSQELI